MKTYSCFVLLWFSTLYAMAQERIVLLRDTTRLNVSLANLKKRYPPVFSQLTVVQKVATEEKGVFDNDAKMLRDTTNARNQRFFSFIERNKKRLPFPGIMIQTQEFVRSDGTFDWVFCEFSGRELSAEQESQFLKLMSEWYNQNPFPFKTKAGFRWRSMAVLGSIRTVRKGNGIISTLEAAEKTTRPDTVKMLALNGLELKNIPDVVYRFPNLEEIDLSRNELHVLPARLTADIPSLKKLSVLYNAIPNDSVFITRNKHLKALNLQGNKLTRIPVTVRQNRRLESLWMGNNELSEIDTKTLRRMRHLTDLNLYNAGLTQLPKTIGWLKRIKVLDLYYNKLTTLPDQLGKMKRLEQLAVAHNELRTLPASFAKLRRLQILYAHHNTLSQLPATFGKLRKLKLLDLGNNWFASVPDVIGTLPNLEELSLNNNNIQKFPTVLLSLKNLQKLHLGRNPMLGTEAMKSPYAAQIRQLEANKTEVTY